MGHLVIMLLVSANYLMIITSGIILDREDILNPFHSLQILHP